MAKDSVRTPGKYAQKVGGRGDKKIEEADTFQKMASSEALRVNEPGRRSTGGRVVNSANKQHENRKGQ